MTEPFGLWLANLCSVLNRQAKLEFMFDQQAPNILVVTESWLHSDVQNAEIVLPGYDLFRQDRQIKKNGSSVFIFLTQISAC